MSFFAICSELAYIEKHSSKHASKKIAKNGVGSLVPNVKLHIYYKKTFHNEPYTFNLSINTKTYICSLMKQTNHIQYQSLSS